MRVCDTSALYAAVHAEDAHHAEARAALQEDESLLVPAEVWVETMALLQYRHGHAKAMETGTALRALPHLEVQPTPDDPWDNVAARADAIHRANAKLSLADSIVVAWCQRRECRPFTFDKALLAACPPTPK